MTNHQYYNVLGVMSGTSLDGVDIAHITLVRKEQWSFTIHHAISVPYPTKILTQLKKAIHLDQKELLELDQEYTRYLGEILNDFIANNQINNLLAICSHGHTIHHQPEKKYTYQIGNLPELAQITKHRIVCDFRVQDVVMGGQGAPLVPIGDRLLFSNYDCCMNLGGFANLSFEKAGKRLAYDICPVNVVLNHYALKLGKEYDDGGAFAKAGTPQTTALKKLNELAFYHQPYPKSLGMEWIYENVFPILEKIKDPKDALATFTENTAFQIAQNLSQKSKVLVTGGGTYNEYLLSRVKDFKELDFAIPDPTLIEYKEALIFALLGVLKLRNANNCLASVTGAPYDHSSGVIFNP